MLAFQGIAEAMPSGKKDLFGLGKVSVTEHTRISFAVVLQTILTNSTRQMKDPAAELSQQRLNVCGRGVTWRAD
jgi:hypothetical protein